MKRQIFLTILLFLAVLVCAQTNRPRVGVLDFIGNNISEVDAQVVGEMFTSELVLSGKYDVVDRKNIESIMQEMDFQLSGCTDSSCALEIGQILSLDKMLYGSINKLGKDYIINVYMIDVVTAQIEGSARERFPSLEDSYDIMDILIEKLVQGNDYNGEKVSASADKKAGTVPPEASGSQADAGSAALYAEIGLGAIVGDYESGIELEAGVRYMFDSLWGLGLSALLGFPFDDAGPYFGLNARGHIQLSDFFGFSVGFRGFPEYLNSYGGLFVGLYLWDFFVEGGIQVIAGEGFNIDVGYAFKL